jgi:hypothetical protein
MLLNCQSRKGTTVCGFESLFLLGREAVFSEAQKERDPIGNPAETTR